MILRTPTENENGELRRAGMDGRHPGVQDASGDIHVGLIIMKAMQTVTAVLGRTDRGGDTLWKTLHWMFTSITPGHESRTHRAKRCTRVGWCIAAGASRTSFSDGVRVLRWP